MFCCLALPDWAKPRWLSIVAKELGVGFRATSAPMISKSGDLAAILTNLERNDVLFIDEIHRLNPAIEEVLYSAMEDFQLDLIMAKGHLPAQCESICSRLLWWGQRPALGC